MTLIAMFVSIIIATASLAWGYSASNQSQYVNGLLVVGAFWLFGEWRRLGWVASLALLLFIAAAAAGLWIGLPSSLMVIGAVAALLGWDLSGFSRRLRFASRADDIHGLESRHLGRVAVVAALALIIAGIVAFVRVRLPFEVAVALALLGALGLTRLVFWIQRENDL